MNKFKQVLLFSGGIDSFVAYHFLDKPQTIYFDLHTRYIQKEKRVVNELIPTTIIDDSLNLQDREYGKNAYVPFRNLLLACQAAKYSDTIIIAGLADDMVSDKNEQVFQKFSLLLSELEGRNILVDSPFWKMTKEEVVKWYIENINDDFLLKTISCYSSENINYCGKCPSCFRKWCALYCNGIKLDYYNESLMMEYYKKALNGFYIPQRNKNIMEAVNGYFGRY